MKSLILYILIASSLFATEDIKYYANEHNYDRYNLKKKPVFIQEIEKENILKYSHYIKVFYLNNKAIKYQMYGKNNTKIHEIILSGKGYIWKGFGINGYKFEYFYKKKMKIEEYIENKHKIIVKTYFMHNRIVYQMKYDNGGRLLEIIVYDFNCWSKRIYNARGVYIGKEFLAKPNK